MQADEALRYIKVRRHKRIYKVFLKDLKGVLKVKTSNNKPPVPSFHHDDMKRVDSTSEDSMEFEPVHFVLTN